MAKSAASKSTASEDKANANKSGSNKSGANKANGGNAPKNTPPKNTVPRFVVGLGASAGGLDALETFLDHAPTQSGAAFFVVMHLSRDFKSMLDELLARHTDMAVKPAENGIKFEADTVYVIQPKTFIEVGATKLIVEARPDVDPSGVATAVDVMFNSIAKTWGKKGAAVVLSGSGSDGAKGIVAVQKAGGFTCAQSPETAKFDPMPIAAIGTECVNAVESPDQLGQTVIDGLLTPTVAPQSPIASDHDNAMGKIVDAVIGSSTIKAREYKHSTFERRVSRRMMALRYNDLAEYADKVTSDPSEAQKLSQELLIGVTDFFRDSAPYKVISRQIVPEIIKVAHEENRAVRIWVAGCATGEEVYSIAMLFREALRDNPFEIDVQIFATDVSKKHLAEATRGSYSPDRVSGIPRPLLERYFEKDAESGNWVAIQRLRKMIVFAPHDLLSDPPFTKLDLVCCRNVLIYFSVEAQQRILGGFAFGLRQKGFLFLGSSETVGGQRDVFEFVDARNRVFRRTLTIAPARALTGARELFPISPSTNPAPRKSTRLRVTELQPAYAALLAQFAPASLLISEDRELLHTFGDASKFLRPPEGMVQMDTAEMVDPALKTPLIAAIERANREDGPMTFSKISLQSEQQKGLVVDLTLQPLDTVDEESQRYFLAILAERKDHEGTAPEEIPSIEADKLIAGRNSDLELELTRTREALQSTIEENETANEELQASNEELMSANEELQSTNEELSSVNEELYSVNAEYHRQNDDLSRLTNDFDLLLNATQIGVLFLDDDGNITRFTGLAKALFKLEENDIGRPVSNFNSPFANFDFENVFSEIPGRGSVVEHETIDRNGSPWLIRIVSDDANFGVVLAFIDIGELRGAELELRETHSMLHGIRTVTNAFILVCDAEFKTVISQVGYDEFTGLENLQLPYELTLDIVHDDDLEKVKKLLGRIRPDMDDFELIFRVFSLPTGEYRYVRVIGQRQENTTWQVVANDVDEIYRTEIALHEQRAILEAMLTSSRSYTAFINKNGIYGFANPAYCAFLDRKIEDVIDRGLGEVMPPQLYAQTQDDIVAALNGEAKETVSEVMIGGEQVLLSARYRPVEDGGQVIGFVFDGVNISEVADYAEKFAYTDRLVMAATRRLVSPMMLVNQSDGRILYANQSAEKALGLANDEFSDSKFSISRLTPECGEARWLEFLARLGRQGSLVLDDMVVFGEAKKTWVSDIELETYESGSDHSIVSVRVNRNESKQKTIRDLRERSNKLASSNRDLEQFTTAVAHDLRAPLRHITAFSDILGTKSEELQADEIRKHSQIIASSARNLSNMVSGLLNYARIGLSEAPMDECDLGSIITQAQENLSAEINSSTATVNVTGSGKMQGNADLLVSLFQNLISNSIKYVSKGVNPEIEIDIKERSDQLIVSVSDNGIGIDSDFRENIFNLFKRLHSDGEYSGLGIGLTTCRKIAEMHNSQLALDPGYRGGSRFIFAPASMDLP